MLLKVKGIDEYWIAYSIFENNNTAIISGIFIIIICIIIEKWVGIIINNFIKIILFDRGLISQKSIAKMLYLYEKRTNYPFLPFIYEYWMLFLRLQQDKIIVCWLLKRPWTNWMRDQNMENVSGKNVVHSTRAESIYSYGLWIVTKRIIIIMNVGCFIVSFAPAQWPKCIYDCYYGA